MLIIFCVGLPLPFIIDQIHKSKFRVIIGFILYPILLVILSGLVYYFGGIFGFDTTSLTIDKIIESLSKCWWCLFIFWPVVLLRLPLELIGRGKSGEKNKIVPVLFIPIYEEFAFRFLAINTIYLLTQSILISLIFSAIAFTIIHLFNKSGDHWGGPIAINGTLIMGFVFGIIAIQYGLIFSIAAHIINNIFAILIMPKIIKD
jgi:hypothetical protein